PSRALHLASARTHEIPPPAGQRTARSQPLARPESLNSHCANARDSFPHVRGVGAERKPHCRQITLHREAARPVEFHVRALVPCKHERFVLTPGRLRCRMPAWTCRIGWREGPFCSPVDFWQILSFLL